MGLALPLNIVKYPKISQKVFIRCSEDFPEVQL